MIYLSHTSESVNSKEFYIRPQKNKQHDAKQWENRLQTEADKRIREVQQWQEAAARNMNQAQALQAALDNLQQQQQQQVR